MYLCLQSLTLVQTSLWKASLNPEIFLSWSEAQADVCVALKQWMTCDAAGFAPPQIFRRAAPRWWWAGWVWRVSSEPLCGRWCWRWTRRRSALPDGRREMRAARNESDGGSDGDGEAMHRGNMQGELGVPGRWGPVKEQRVPADAVDLRHVYSTDTHHRTEQQGLLGLLLGNMTNSST